MQKNELIILVCMVFLVSFSACGPSRSAAEVEVIDGVTWIHNPPEPASPGKRVEFSEDITFGGEDLSGDDALYNPVRFAVDESGSVFIADAQEWRIKVFDQSGSYLKSIGNRGQGPGEFMHVTALGFTPDGRLLILDVRSRRTSLFTADGEFLESYPWRSRHVRLFWIDDSSYLSDEYVSGGESIADRRLLIKEYGFDGEEIRSWGEFVMEKFFTLSEGWDPPPSAIKSNDQWLAQFHLRFTPVQMPPQCNLGIVLCPGHATLQPPHIVTERAGPVEVVHIGDDLVRLHLGGQAAYQGMTAPALAQLRVGGVWYAIDDGGIHEESPALP